MTNYNNLLSLKKKNTRNIEVHSVFRIGYSNYSNYSFMESIYTQY